MTLDFINEEIQRIKTDTKLSLAGVQVEMMGLMIKVLAAPKIAPDQYMEDIAAFHVKFGLPYTGEPRQLTPEACEFRLRCLREEVDEYEEAIRTNNLEAQFDSLIDLVYFALGTAYQQGFPFQRGWQRVQEANMKKVRATKDIPGKRRSTLDVVKPEDWVPPSLTDLVNSPL